MKLKAAINGSVYDIVEGATFADEYSETLDSGAIIIDKVQKFDLRPYDDVFIFDADEDEYRGWGNHVSQSYMVDLEENVHYVMKDQTSIIGVTTTVPPTPIWAVNTAINISKREMDPLISRIASGGGWYAQIRCDSYYEQPQSGTEYIKDNIGFVALYRITAQIGFPDSYLIFDKIPSANEYGNPPLKMTYKAGALDQYYTMSSDLPDSPRIYFINPRFSSYIEIEPTQGPIYKGFHKHMLVDQYEATCINITSRTYKYKIDLFSETKKLEKIILPNIALTQPIPLAKRRSVWGYLNRYIERYSPKIKIGIPPTEGNVGTWSYVRKYSLDPNLQSSFEDVYAPEMQMNQPTLRDVLTQLMLTKDMIPYVEDDVIKGMDLSRTSGDFAYSDDETTSIVTSMSSSNYATGLKRQFDNALAQNNTCKRVEYLGFRNSDEGLLTLQNLRLEFSYPIYKIDRMLVCYWKKMDIIPEGGGASQGTKYFLCKQDITPLILQNQRRNILSKDWDDFPGTPMSISTEQMAEYKIYTIGYDIGSREITGWSEIYSFPKNGADWWFDDSKSYIENIISIIDQKNPFGIYKDGWELVEAELPSGTKGSPADLNLKAAGTYPQSPYSQSDAGSSLWIKGLLFQVEYQAFYSGSTYADKEDDRDDIVSPDNPSSSLTVLEKDGIFQEAKANRFGNEAMQINCRYADPSGMQPLASVFGGDEIVFRREYSVFSNITQVAYSATKGYILKNYFTSVFAQLRPFPLAGYDQSVNKAETKRAYIKLSKDTLYYDDPGWASPEIYLSAFSPSQEPASINDYRNPYAINYQTITKESSSYASDVNVFVNGHSLCVSFSMRDNLGMGNFIKNAKPFDSKIYQNALGWDTDEWKTGSIQAWWPMIDDTETGELDTEIAFIGYNIEESPQVMDMAQDVDDAYEDDYFNLPKTETTGRTIISITDKPMKDQKEVLNETVQFEYQTEDGIAISEMMPTLNDALGIKLKWPTDTVVSNTSAKSASAEVYGYTTRRERLIGDYFQVDMTPTLVIGIPNGAVAIGTKLMINGSNQIGWASTYTKNRYKVESSMSNPQLHSPAVQKLRISDIRITAVGATDITVQFTASGTIWRNYQLWIGERQFNCINTKTLPISNLFSKTGFTYYTTGDGINSVINVEPDFQIRGDTILDNAPQGMFNVDDLSGLSALTPIMGELFVMQPTSVTLPQNQFVVYSQSKVKKERMYDEYASIDASNEAFTDVFSADGNQITINLANAPEGTKSVQYWYLDQDSGAYRFVFGVDVTQAELDRGYAIVWASVTQTKDRRVYDFAMNQIGECANAARDIELSDGRYYN